MSAFNQLAVNATEWQSAEWAFHKGLYNEVFTDLKEMDKTIFELAQKLSKSSPEAMALLKKAMWKGTEDWDKLLEERAEMSGKLVLSDFTRNAINAFKNNQVLLKVIKKTGHNSLSNSADYYESLRDFL